MSISGSNYSAISLALQQVHVPLVNPSVVLPQDMFEWEFDVLKIKESVVLCNVIGKFFEVLFNVEEMDIDPSTLARYIAEVGRHYHDRPFHNLQHASCVTHFTFMLIKASNAMEHLKTHQVFGILVSAIVHDVDHPGNTNLFEINSGSELALRYNDQSVLENHHCSTAFRIMRKPSMQVLSRVSKAIAVDIRKTIISCVMATDMAVHFDLIEETKKRAMEGWKFEEAKDQALLGKILLHAADLSNPVRPFHMTRQWAERISIEFNDQVSREQALGMPVLGFMMTPDEKSFCKNETGFASFVVAPMWRAISMLYPNLCFLVDQLDNNLLTWKACLEKLQAEENNNAALQESSRTNEQHP
jgi:3',5'-cyclic-nucleotide phosphodiesterase